MWCWAVTLWPAVSGRSGRLGIFPGGFSDIHEIFHGLLARFQDLLPRFQELYGMIGITQLNMIAKWIQMMIQRYKKMMILRYLKWWAQSCAARTGEHFNVNLSAPVAHILLMRNHYHPHHDSPWPWWWWWRWRWRGGGTTGRGSGCQHSRAPALGHSRPPPGMIHSDGRKGSGPSTITICPSHVASNAQQCQQSDTLNTYKHLQTSTNIQKASTCPTWPSCKNVEPTSWHFMTSAYHKHWINTCW